MKVRIDHHYRGALLAVLVLTWFCALVTGAAAVNIVTGSYQIPSVGGSTSVPVVLDAAPSGISGYKITVALGDPSVAEISAVSFPAWATLNSATNLPAGQVTLQAVDLSQQVPVGGTSITLATLTVTARAAGSTTITVTPDQTLGVQDRSGSTYTSAGAPGTLTVGGGAPIQPTMNPTVAPTASTTQVMPPTMGPTQAPTVPVVSLPTAAPTPIATPVEPTGAPIQPPVATPVSQPPAPVETGVPVVVSPTSAPGVISPVVVAPTSQPAPGFGKRYAIGNPGTFISTRFGSGGNATVPAGSKQVTGPAVTLKPGSRSYGITPPAGRFIRWYPAARWAAGLH